MSILYQNGPQTFTRCNGRLSGAPRRTTALEGAPFARGMQQGYLVPIRGNPATFRAFATPDIRHTNAFGEIPYWSIGKHDRTRHHIR